MTREDERTHAQELFDKLKYYSTEMLFSSLYLHRIQRQAAEKTVKDELIETDVRIAILYNRLHLSSKKRRKKRKQVNKSISHRDDV